MGTGASIGVSVAVASLKQDEVCELLSSLPEVERQKIRSALDTKKEVVKPASSAKTRLSFTDMGGVCPGIVQATDTLPFEGTFAAGDRIEVDAPDLKEHHGKVGSIVTDLGMTPKGPRIAVQLDGMDEEISMPPACLVRVKAPGDEVDPKAEARKSNTNMRGDRMSGCLEFIPFEEKTEAAEADAEEEEAEEEDDEDSGGEDLPPPPPPETRKPRTSVSAEAYGQWNKKVEYTPVVIPKSEEQKDRIKATLQKSWMFDKLDEVPLKIVINAMQEKNIPAGTRIINQGDEGDVMFVIEEGELECYKKMKPDEDEKLVKTCKTGDVFGELALLYFCPRAASCQTKDQCTVWQLDRETFNAIVKEAAEKAHNKEDYEGFEAPPKKEA